eukprot:TRINITY_DN6214_c0_g1_i1.p1 TRINITY_DN6214_c0_g1~~TRINITY_DN6214_c0_g1_i1.p1  ORF type:complete len:104 (-),score=12.47 TRINITY_DN6214_c0_g1_i1:92-361(-)
MLVSRVNATEWKTVKDCEEFKHLEQRPFTEQSFIVCNTSLEQVRSRKEFSVPSLECRTRIDEGQRSIFLFFFFWSSLTRLRVLDFMNCT